MKNKEINYKLFRPIAIDKRLNKKAKMVAMFVYTLNDAGKKCSASNSYIAKKLRISSNSVKIAIISLQENCLILDLRKDQSCGYIKVGNSLITTKPYYNFNSNILNKNLKLSTKFLLVYILSFNRQDKKCTSSDVTIMKAIGLSMVQLYVGIIELSRSGLLKSQGEVQFKREITLHLNKI